MVNVAESWKVRVGCTSKAMSIWQETLSAAYIHVAYNSRRRTDSEVEAIYTYVKVKKVKVVNLYSASSQTRL